MSLRPSPSQSRRAAKRVLSSVGTQVRRSLDRFGYDLIRQGPEFPPDFDDATAAIVRAVRPFTMTSPERIFALCEAVRYLERTAVHGSIVECGVWRGGSIMAVAKTLLDLGITDRDLHLFDTFEGMTAPTDRDVELGGVPASSYFAPSAPDAPTGGRSPLIVPSPLEEVRTNVASTGYPSDRTFFVQGPVEDTVPGSAPDRIALLRLDTDWYESTRHELVHLYPLIVGGGVLIIDDYGHWGGSRDAVDEYLREHGLHLLLQRVDYSCRVAVVP